MFRTSLRVVACLTLFFFVNAQIGFSQENLALLQQSIQASKDAETPEKPEVSPDADQTLKTSQEFLEETIALSRVDKKSEEKKQQPSLDYEYERYDFEDALELLRPEYAAAVILKDLKKEDLQKLLDLSFETGILVLHGEIVLFTSGSENEIGILPAVNTLVSKASFISHTHPNEHSAEGPSGYDIREAVSTEEYVLTGNGAYVYNDKGVLNGGEAVSFESYLEKIREAAATSKVERGQVEARRDLNTFIAEQDRYNESSEEKITFRRDGSIGPTAGLSSSSVTTLTGSPHPYAFSGSSAGTALSSSSDRINMDYDVTSSGSHSGFSVSFDDASTTGVEYVSISALTYLTLGLKGPNAAVKVEIVDTAGAKDTWTLNTISPSTEKFWQIQVASLSGINTAQIKQLNFIVTQAETTAQTRTGTMVMRIKGMNLDNPATPVVNSNVPTWTNQTTLNLSGTKEANTAVLINGTEVIALNGLTTWNYTVNLTSEGNNSVSVRVKNSIAKTSSQVSYTVKRDTTLPTNGTMTLQGNAVYATSTTVNLTGLGASDTGSGVDKMSFSNDGNTWTTPENVSSTKTHTLLSGDGNKTVYVRFIDKAGNYVTVSKSIILETQPPSGSININGGAQYIAQVNANLNLSASDAGSGLSKMSFSSDGTNWSAEENYATTKSWEFSSGDGAKTVYVKFKDVYGNWSTPVSASTSLDTTAPTGSIQINGNSDFTGSRDVTLTLSASDALSGLDQVNYSLDGGNTWTGWENFSASKNLTLPAGDGSKQVTYLLKDILGNERYLSDTISLDTTGPDGSVSINGGASETTTVNVTLTLTASDTASGVDDMRFSTDGGVNWTSWEDFSTSRNLTLSSGSGLREVRYQIRDVLGNAREFSDSITLVDPVQALPPAFSATRFTNLGTGTAQVELQLDGPQPGWNPATFSYSVDDANFSAPQAFSSTALVSLPEGWGLLGRRSIRIIFYKADGTPSETYREEVNVDAIRAVASFVPAAADDSIDDLVDSGLLRTDETGNIRNLYERSLLLENTSFAQSTFRIEPVTQGATLPNLHARFSLDSISSQAAFETGFTVLDKFDPSGYAATGTAKLVLEDGYFKLKVKRPGTQEVDGVSFSTVEEEVILSELTPQSGVTYDLEFNYTLDGLEIYLHKDKARIAAMPLFVLQGVEANPYLDVQTSSVTLKRIRMYGDTNKILAANNELHELTYVRNGSGKVTKATDSVSWSRFENPGLNTVSYQTVKDYTDQGRLTRVTDKNGDEINWHYFTNGTLAVREESAKILSESWTYTTENGNSVVTKTRYSEDGYANSVNAVTKETFDAQNRRIGLLTPDGKNTTFSYAADGTITAQTSHAGKNYTNSLKLDSRGRAVRIVNRAGIVEIRNYVSLANGSEKLTILKQIPDVNTAGSNVTYNTEEWIVTDLKGRVIETRNINGELAAWQYDADGYLTNYTDEKGRVTAWFYVKNQLGRKRWGTATLSYTDDFGNAVQRVTTYNWDAYENVGAEISPEGEGIVHAKMLYYNNRIRSRWSHIYQNVTSMEDLWSRFATPSNVVVETQWSETGEVILQTGRNGVREDNVFSYDALGNLVSRVQTAIYQDGAVQVQSATRFDFDIYGNVTKQTDAYGHETHFTYDTFNNLLTTRFHHAGDTQNTFDRFTTRGEVRNASGVLLSVQDVETYTDAFGNAASALSLQAFDVFGNLTRQISANGSAQVIEYEYADDGRVLSRSIFSYLDVFSLAALDQLHLAAPSLLKEKEEYGRLEGEVKRHETSDGKVETFEYLRDALGRLQRRTLKTAWIAEDLHNILTTAFSEFDVNGNVTREVAANGDETLYTYGAKGSLTNLTRKIHFTENGNSNLYQEQAVFHETRQANGNLTSAWQTIQGVDSFQNPYSVDVIRNFDAFGNETSSIDRAGKGRVTEYVRFAWNGIQEVRVYEYEGVTGMTDLLQRHASAPKLIEKNVYDFRGEVVRNQNKEGMVTNYEWTRRINGSLQQKKRRVQVPGEAEQLFTEDYDVQNRLTRATDQDGIHTDYSYALNGELLNEVEAGQGNHQITKTYFLTTYANGAVKTEGSSLSGVDRFGRQVNLASAQEFTQQGDLAYSVSENEEGQIVELQFDGRQRLRQKKTYRLRDGDGFVSYAIQNLGAPSGTQHLSLGLLKQWFQLYVQNNAAILQQFAPEILTQNWDEWGHETVSQTKDERQETAIVTNDLGQPSQILKKTYSSIGENGPILTFPVEAKSRVPAQAEPSIQYNGQTADLSALTAAGIGLVILNQANPAQATVKTYSTSQFDLLKADLTALANGDMIILVTRGDISASLDTQFLGILENFGSSKANGLQHGGALSLIGIKGGSDAIEDYQKETGETSSAVNFRTTVETFDVRGSLTQYQDGFGGLLNYTRGFDGEALRLVETREQGAWTKTTDYQKQRNAQGHLLNTVEEVEEINTQAFEDAVSFERDWNTDSTGHAISGGRLTVDPASDRWVASIFPQDAGDHSLSGNFSLVDSANAEVYFMMRYLSAGTYFGFKLTREKIQVVQRENGAETVLQEADINPDLTQSVVYDFSASLTGRQLVFSLGGSSLLNWQVPAATEILNAGSLALAVENGKASFDAFGSKRDFVKGRGFSSSEILNSRTDQNGVTSYFNADGDVIRIEDPANSTVKIYEIEKYATGGLKSKKETISITVKNVDGQNVITSVTTRSYYDLKGNVTRFIDSENGETIYAYTDAGEVASTNFPDGTRIEYIYEADVQTGSRSTTEIHLKMRKNALGAPVLNAQGSPVYDEESRVKKTHDKDGDLIFLMETQASEETREEIDYTYTRFPGADRKMQRKEAVHRFINKTTGAEVLRYTTFEEWDNDGLLLESRDNQGTERIYTYRELVSTGTGKNLKRVATLRETRAGDVTMHYYFYHSNDSYAGLSFTPPSYWDLDQDEAKDADDLDFVIQVRDRGTAATTDDDVQAVQYSGVVESERIERRLVYKTGGMTALDRESAYVYHFDGVLDQLIDYKYPYLYNVSTNQLERQPKTLVSTTTYKADSGTGQPHIDKVTDAFSVKNYHYTSSGRLERIEETNGAFPNRLTVTRYDGLGDIASVTDFYGRTTYNQYVKNSEGRNIGLFQTNDQNEGRLFRMFNAEGEVILELDRNARLTLFDIAAHPSQLGKTVIETQYLLKDSAGFLTAWFHNPQGNTYDFNSLMSTFDRNADGKIEDSDIELLFNASGFAEGTTLHRDKNYRLLNLEGDLVLSFTPEGEISINDYAKDILEAKSQTQWTFTRPDAAQDFARIFPDAAATQTAAWATLTEKLLKAGSRDYEELTAAERTAADQSRLDAMKEYFLAAGLITQASQLNVSKTVRKHNSNGEIIEETEATGVRRNYVYNRDAFGAVQSSLTTHTLDGAVIYQEFNTLGEVVRQRYSSGLVKIFTYEKDARGNTIRVTENTVYPHDPAGAGATEIRTLNLLGEVISVTDRNGAVTDIVIREKVTGEKEIQRRIYFLDSFGNPVDFTETEKQNRYGNTISRTDRNGRETILTHRYNSMSRVWESVEINDYTQADGQHVHYEELTRYDNEGQQILTRDRNGREISFEYVKDSAGNTVEIRERETMPGGAVALSVRKLSPLGETLTVTDKNGQITGYYYNKDSKGNITTIYEAVKLRFDFTGDMQVDDRDLSALQAAYGSTAAANLAKFDLTGNGAIDEDDAKALTRSREYGTREAVTVKQVSLFGDMLSITDRNGYTVYYQYLKDAKGNQLRSLETNNRYPGAVSRFFDIEGKLAGLKDASGNSVKYRYTLDAKGNVIESVEEQTLAPKPAEAPVVTTVNHPDGSYTETEKDSKGVLRETLFDAQGKKVSEKLRAGMNATLASSAVISTSGNSDPVANPPSRLNDGIHDRNNPWYSLNQADGYNDEYVVLDLGAMKTFSEVRVDTGVVANDYFVRHFEVSVSDDNINWRKVGGANGLTAQGIQTVSFTEQQARYVRIDNFQSMNIEGNTAKAGLNEIEVAAFDYTTSIYETDAQNNLTVTTSDALGVLSVKTYDAAGRETYSAERKQSANPVGPDATAVGDAKIDTVSKFGDGALKFDGNSDYVQMPDSEDFNFGTGDFTVDFWAKPEAIGTTQFLAVWDYEMGSDYNGISLQPDGSLHAFFGAAVKNGNIYYHQHVQLLSPANAIQAGQWQHIAVARQGTQIAMFINGNKVAEQSWIYSTTNTSTGLRLGSLRYDGYVFDYRGSLDEFRMSKGVARWTSNFTPPTGEYSADAAAKRLLHFNKYQLEEKLTSYETDAQGNTTKTVRDAANQVISTEIRNNQNQITYFKDAASELWYVYTVDAGNLITTVNDAAGLFRRETRNPQGTLFLVTDRKTDIAGTNYYTDTTYQDVFDIDGVLIRTDRLVRLNGTLIATLLGIPAGMNAKDDLTSALPVAVVTNSGNLSGPELANDGKFGAYARAPITGTMTFELEEAAAVSRMDTYFHYNQGLRYAIETSLDGVNWYEVVRKTGPGNFKGLQTDTFETVKAKFIRIKGYQSETGLSEFNVDEVRIYPPAGWPVTSVLKRTFSTQGDLLSEYMVGGSAETFTYEKDALGNIARIFESHRKTNPSSAVDYTTVRRFDYADKIEVPVSSAASFVGDSQLSTASPKAGSAALLLDGSGDYVQLPASEDWNFGTGDFTIDMNFRIKAGTTNPGAIYDNATYGGGGVRILMSSMNQIWLNITTSAQNTQFGYNVSLSAETWYHIALVRVNGVIRLFLNGVQLGTDQTDAGNIVSQQKLNLGGWYYSYSGTYNDFFNGMLDEVRVSKGIARWTSNFTPPAGEYTADSYTKLLLHFNGANGSKTMTELQTSGVYPKEGQLIESLDRQGKLTRYSYEYDALGNQIGTYQLTQRGSGADLTTEFAGEIKDISGRVVQQIDDSGKVTYYSYDLDEFGSIKRAYLRDTPDETVTIQRNLLNAGAYSVSSPGWTDAETRADRINYLFDGSLDTGGSMNLNTNEEKTLTFDFSGGKSPEAWGDSQVSTNAPKFGDGSVYFDGNGDYLQVADSDDYNFGTGDFTVDFWAKPDSIGSAQFLAAWDYENGSDYNGILIQPDGSLHVFFGAAVKNGNVYYHQHVELLSPANAIQAGQWQHIAVARQGTQIALFINGSKVAEKTWTYAMSNTTRGLRIGSLRYESYVFDYRGSIDEFRMSKGVARWMNNFTPPTSEYQTDDATKVLFHFNGANQSKFFMDSSRSCPAQGCVNLSRVRFFTEDRPTAGYRIETSLDGVNWTTAVDQSAGPVKKQWNDFDLSGMGARFLRLSVFGSGIFKIDEIQIFENLAPARNFQIFREYDSRGNVVLEKNALYKVWEDRADLRRIFSDPAEKSLLAGRWKNKTLAEWAKEAGYLEDPRLADYAPQSETLSPQLKEAFDQRRDLQKRFTDEASLRDWAEKAGSQNDPRLAAYEAGRSQSSEAASGNVEAQNLGVLVSEQLDAQGRVIYQKFATNQTQDRAEGKSVTSSGYIDELRRDSSATDGNASTYWISNSHVDSTASSRWLKVDMGETFAINRIVLSDYVPGSNNYMKDFKIKVSTDGVNYTEVVNVVNKIGNAVNGYDIPEIQARYILVSDMIGRNGSGNSDYPIISSLQAFGKVNVEQWTNYSTDAQGNVTAEVTDALGLVRKEMRDTQGRLTYLKTRGGATGNLMQGKSATASTTYNSTTPVTYGVDGNPNTGWLSSYNSAPNWYLVDLGSAQPMHQIQLDTRYMGNLNYTLDSFRVEVTADDPANANAVWTEVAYQTNTWRNTDWTIDFAERQVRGVRLKDMTAKNDSGGAYLYAMLSEISGYGFTYSEESTTYQTNAQNQVTITSSDAQGVVRQETFDAQGRSIYLKERTASSFEETSTTYQALAGGDTGKQVRRILGAESVLLSDEVYNAQGVLVSKQIRTSAGNVARNITPTVSGSSPDAGPTDLTDGVFAGSGTWVSAAQGQDEWVQLDLGSAVNISEMRVDTRWLQDLYVSHFNIKISTDGTNWETLVVEANLTTANQWKYFFADKPARYVRIDGIRGRNASGNYYGFLGEVEIYASEMQAVTIENTPQHRVETFKERQELAAGKTATATTNAGTNLDASKLVDGRVDTPWSSLAGFTANSVVVDLWNEYEISEARLLAAWSGYLKSFRLSTSTDGINWQTASTASGGTAEKDWILNFAPRQARYVRVDQIEAANGAGAFKDDFINELRVFGYVPVTIESDFDEAGRLVKQARKGGREEKTLEYAYDSNGKLSELREYGPEIFEMNKIGFNAADSIVSANLIDGNENTSQTVSWIAGNAPASMTVRLSRMAELSTVRLKTGGDINNGFAYSIEASKDGVNWFTVVDETSARLHGWQEDSFPPVTAQYLRVTGSADNSWGRTLTLYEIEAYEANTFRTPVSVKKFEDSGRMIANENALFLVWQNNSALQTLYPDPKSASFVQWAQTQGYKLYASLAHYAPVQGAYASGAATEVLPGLRQVLDDVRGLQDRLRIDGTKDSGLIQYARLQGYREDYRLADYSPVARTTEMARINTFEARLDFYGNQTVLIARDQKGSRVQRKYDRTNGQLTEEKDELMLLWEERADLYSAYRNSADLRNWAVNTGSRDMQTAAALSAYSPYGIGGETQNVPTVHYFQNIFSSLGYLSEAVDIFWRIEGNELKRERTLYDADGRETSNILPDGTFDYTYYKDSQGRAVRRTGSGGNFQPLDELVNLDSPRSSLDLAAATRQIVQQFLMLIGRLPSAAELGRELQNISTQGVYASRLRLSMTAGAFGLGASTVEGMLDGSLVQNYGNTGAQDLNAQIAAQVLTAERAAAAASEFILETRYLEVVTQKSARRMLGRDANEEAPQGGGDSELTQLVNQFRTLDSLNAFENYLKNNYNLDAQGHSEHYNRTQEIHAIIDAVDLQLRIYFGYADGTLGAGFENLLKLLKADTAFSIAELSLADIDKVKARLLELIDEDIHFGQSAVNSLREMIERILGTSAPSMASLTTQALFVDILTGVISPEFTGNLQFSAYNLKTVAAANSAAIQGFRLTWEELTRLVMVSGKPVMVNIEDRHYVVVISITDTTVTFLENGHTRTKSVAEFKPKWFGVGLVQTGTELFKVSRTYAEMAAALTALGAPFIALIKADPSDPNETAARFVEVLQISGGNVEFKENGVSQQLSEAQFQALFAGYAFLTAGQMQTLGFTLSNDPDAMKFFRFGTQVLRVTAENNLSAADLLKVKGAGWFSKLFKKIVKIFVEIVKPIIKVLEKIVAITNRVAVAIFGKTVGKFISGILTAPLNFYINSYHYAERGDFKGLFKYWAMTAVQAVIQVVLFFIPVIGQIIGAILNAILQAVLSVVKAVLQAVIQIMGQVITGITNAIGSLSSGFGSGISQLAKGVANFAKSAAEFGRSVAGKVGSYIDKFKEAYKPQNLKEAFFNNLKEQINPLTGYQNLFKGFSDALKGVATKGGFTKLVTDSLKKFALNFAAQKVDQQIQKSKMGEFWKGVLSTVANVGIQAVGNQAFSSVQEKFGLGGAQSAKAAPVGTNYVTGFLTDLRNGVTNFLKDAGGAIKSIFVKSPEPGLTRGSLFSETADEIGSRFGINPDGSLKYYSPEGLDVDIEYSASYRDEFSLFDTDEGNFLEAYFNSFTNQVSQQRVGNFSGVGEIRQAAPLAEQLWNNWSAFVTTDPTMQSIGGYTVGFVEGFYGSAVSALKSGTNPVGSSLEFGSMIGQMLRTPQASLEAIRGNIQQTYNVLTGPNNYESSRLVGQFTGGTIFGIATSGVGKNLLVDASALQRSRVLANIAESQAARAASRFEGLSYIKTPQGLAFQEVSETAMLARRAVQNGANLYRRGTLEISNTGSEAQFWAMENPTNPNYNYRYGIPSRNVDSANFVEISSLKPGSQFITRPAPGVGGNAGGAIEVVTVRNGTLTRTFHYLGEKSK